MIVRQLENFAKIKPTEDILQWAGSLHLDELYLLWWRPQGDENICCFVGEEARREPEWCDL